MANKQKFYVVWKGRKTGVFTSWEMCSAQVKGYPEAEYKAFPNRAAAEEAFQKTYEDYKGKRVPTLSKAMLDVIGDPIADSFSVDAACSGNPGLMEYQCVHTTTGKRVFHQGPFKQGNNNTGEFLALVHALALFAEKGIEAPIYSDSKVAISWVKNKHCKTKLPRNAENEKVFDLIARAEDWLAANPIKNQLLKWDTNAWGEIPADFGRK